MGKFDGKIFLELGTNIGSVEIVKYAKSEGAYVIVTDYLPIEKSEAKQYANETAMISTQDFDKVVEFAQQKKVDGVFCGVNESNIRALNEITSRLNVPCYFTKEQWNLCQNKAEFKNLCQKFNVPVAKQYHVSSAFTAEELSAIKYPVIVKPVDLGGSKGIHICYNESQLIEGYRDAYEKSRSHEVIIEEYITGDEISATYTFINGDCKLSMLSQMYYNQEQQGMVPLPEAYIYPSEHLSLYMEKINSNMIKMLKSTGYKNGSIFVTGIATGTEFAFFEAGLRMAGTVPYIFVSYINGINIMHLMTEYAINGTVESQEELEKEDPTLKGNLCCLFSLLNAGGRIAKIEGLEKAKKIPGVIWTTEQRHVGDYIKNDGTLGQINLRFYIVKKTVKEICDTIEKIRDVVKVTDENGNNMLLKSVSSEIMETRAKDCI